MEQIEHDRQSSWHGFPPSKFKKLAPFFTGVTLISFFFFFSFFLHRHLHKHMTHLRHAPGERTMHLRHAPIVQPQSRTNVKVLLLDRKEWQTEKLGNKIALTK